jgi:lysophospholipase L1-like esterase
VLDDLAGLSADLVHPSDEGHNRMGGNLAVYLQHFLAKT